MSTRHARPLLPPTTASPRSEPYLLFADTVPLIFRSQPGLLWSAKGEFAAVQLGFGRFGDIPGLVTGLSDEGTVSVTYMGTTPSSKVVQVPENEFDYDALEAEQRSLLARIRDATTQRAQQGSQDKMILRVQVRYLPGLVLSGRRGAPFGGCGSELKLGCPAFPAQVPQLLDAARGGDIDDPYAGRGLGSKSGGQQPRTLTAMLFLSYAGKGGATDVVVTVDTPPPLVCRQTRTAIPSISGGARSVRHMAQLCTRGAGLPHEPPPPLTPLAPSPC